MRGCRRPWGGASLPGRRQSVCLTFTLPPTCRDSAVDALLGTLRREGWEKARAVDTSGQKCPELAGPLPVPLWPACSHPQRALPPAVKSKSSWQGHCQCLYGQRAWIGPQSWAPPVTSHQILIQVDRVPTFAGIAVLRGIPWACQEKQYPGALDLQVLRLKQQPEEFLSSTITFKGERYLGP